MDPRHDLLALKKSQRGNAPKTTDHLKPVVGGGPQVHREQLPQSSEIRGQCGQVSLRPKLKRRVLVDQLEGNQAEGGLNLRRGCALGALIFNFHCFELSLTAPSSLLPPSCENRLQPMAGRARPSGIQKAAEEATACPPAWIFRFEPQAPPGPGPIAPPAPGERPFRSGLPSLRPCRFDRGGSRPPPR